MTARIRGLTLWRPWTWAITDAGKRVENRSWYPAASDLRAGDWIAIHAGVAYDDEAALALREELDVCVPSRVAMTARAVVAVARFSGAVRPTEAELARVLGVERARAQLRWASGPWCWVLSHVLVLPAPVLCAGAQALFDLPDDVLAQVRAGASEALARVRAARRAGDVSAAGTIPTTTALETSTTHAPGEGAAA